MWLFLLLLIFPASPAFAGEASLGEIVVTPTSPILRPSGQNDLSLSSTTIERKEFEQKKTSLGEVLSESAGVQIRRYGGLDDFATVSIRGATSEQVAVYLDGLLLNSAEGGGVNLATIPTDQIEKIEIYRGAVPSTLGTSPMGGAVFIRTKKPEGRQTRVSGSYGSFNTIDSTVSQSERFGSSYYTADYHFSRSDGDFSFLSDNGTPLNPNDDQTLVRTNNEFQRHQLILKTDSSPRDSSHLAFQEILFREDRGVPGLAGFSSVDADFSTTRSMTKIDWTQKNWNLSPFFTFQKQQFTDLRGEIGLGFRDNDNDTLSYGTDSSAMFLLGLHQKLTFSGNYRGEQFLPEDFISATVGTKSVRNQGAIGLEDEIVLLDERLIFNPSIRSEHIVSDFSSTESVLHPISGKVGARWILEPRLHLRSSFARTYRVASFSELFGDRGSMIGNPSLSPEKGWNWDTGYQLKTDYFSLESSYYLNHLKDLIQVLQTSQLTARAENLRSARIQGVETTLVVPITSFAELSNNYTFQSAKDTSGLPGTVGKSLPGRPQHEVVSKVSLFNRWGKIYTSLEFIDGNFLDSQNLLRVNNRLLLGSGLSWTPIKKITASFDAKNLLNDRISDVVGFPLPGRSFYGKIDLAI